MKIYNYTNTPVTYYGVDIDDKEIFIPPSLDYTRANIRHNGNYFLPTNDENKTTTTWIYQDSSGFKYVTEDFSVPPVWTWFSLFLMSFGVHLLIKIIQKLKIS